MKTYFFFSRRDSNREPIYYCKESSRLMAAKQFAIGKQMSLKSFLSIYEVSR